MASEKSSLFILKDDENNDIDEIEKKRIYDIVTGIENPDDSNKRIRRFLFDYFKKKPESFFLVWDKHDMLISKAEQWIKPERISKIAIFLQLISEKTKDNTIDHHSFKIIMEVNHSTLEVCNNYNQKKNTKLNRNNKYILIMSFHNDDINKSISDHDISFIFKEFKQDKSLSFDHRLLNVLIYLIDSIAIKKEKKFKIFIRDIFWHDKKIEESFLPLSHQYLLNFKSQ